DGVEILRVRVPEPESAPAPDEAPGDGFLAASELIESDSPEIRTLAEEVTAQATNAHEAAKELERWVHHKVLYRGSGIGFASAVETLESAQGDCTENAFLLTALLRARGIPARLVAGLVYTYSPTRASGFAYHVWVEAHLGVWTALDSAVYGEQVDATHLAMAKSTGREEGAMLELSTSMLKGMGRFDLKLVEPR
ncbi:MAG: transglutaminase domain-containing protein, partial [bacterium]|nr:transglutaminase domain-containing protein [bacterium]